MKISVASLEQCPLFKMTSIVSPAFGLQLATGGKDLMLFPYFDNLQKRRSYRVDDGVMLKVVKIFPFW